MIYNKIEISDFNRSKPDLKNATMSKDKIIANWLENWLIENLARNKIKINDLMPSKADLALYLNVSTGTVQNAIKYVEDKGHFFSKQCVGTMVVDYKKPQKKILKASKKDKTVAQLKELILNKRFIIKRPLPSLRILSQMLESSNNTIRLALEVLRNEKIVKHSAVSGWVLIDYPVLSEVEKQILKGNVAKTLSENLIKKIKDYISRNYKIGEKIMPTNKFSKLFNVSARTLHDSLKNLEEQGILISRRGQYGTIVAKNPSEKTYTPKAENSIFSSSPAIEMYHFEKVENSIKKLINEKYDVGEKLPSMQELAKKFNISSNTIRKAVLKLVKDGYLKCERGKYGGTYIIEIPELDSSAFTWLAVSPDYIKD